jgi:hypothetical protein
VCIDCGRALTVDLGYHCAWPDRVSRRNSYLRIYQPRRSHTGYAGFDIFDKMGNLQRLETVVCKDAASVHPSEMLSPRNLTAAAKQSQPAPRSRSQHCSSPRSLMPKERFLNSRASAKPERAQTQSFCHHKICFMLSECGELLLLTQTSNLAS